ncbi:MAG TPA: hypothetical protein DEQ43_03810 [Nocardioides bacterium]|nr:hypothetical protein [Nocardioides sp.]
MTLRSMIDQWGPAYVPAPPAGPAAPGAPAAPAAPAAPCGPAGPRIPAISAGLRSLALIVPSLTSRLLIVLFAMFADVIVAADQPAPAPRIPTTAAPATTASSRLSNTFVTCMSIPLCTGPPPASERRCAGPCLLRQHVTPRRGRCRTRAH